MDDLISRREAIDALDVLCQEHRYRIPGKRETYSQYNEAWQDALGMAEGAILNLPSAQPEPKWIPCSERLPERADNVIICYKAGDYTLVSTGRYLYKFKMWYVDVVGDLRDGVTAWMPLPKAYQGGEK